MIVRQSFSPIIRQLLLSVTAVDISVKWQCSSQLARWSVRSGSSLKCDLCLRSLQCCDADEWIQGPEMLACLLVVSRISTMTLYSLWSVSFAVCDGYKDDCRDRSLKHSFCHIVDKQVRQQLLEKLRVYELCASLATCSDAAERFFSPRPYIELAPRLSISC